MCTVSMVLDHYREGFTAPAAPIFWPQTTFSVPPSLKPDISREEFDLLKHDVEEMKSLVKRAKKYDADNGEPDCEMAEKVALIKKVAALVGVDLGELTD